jgi:hypothetical protein
MSISGRTCRDESHLSPAYEVVRGFASVLSVAPLTYSVSRADVDLVVFCFDKPKDAEASIWWGVVAGDAAAMSLTAEQRQALELIASRPRGCTKGLLLADGFAADMLADLVREGLATAHRGAVRAGGRQIRVERYRITDAGRKAIEG